METNNINFGHKPKMPPECRDAYTWAADIILKSYYDKGVHHSAYIARLAYKYSHEEEYTITNELLEEDTEYDYFCWKDDWYEGQEDVYLIGFIPIEDVQVDELFVGRRPYKY